MFTITNDEIFVILLIRRLSNVLIYSKIKVLKGFFMQKILSPNMLKTFTQCEKKYFYKYEKNISMPVNNEIFMSGKNIHALASYYLKKENIDKMELSLSKKETELWNYLKNLKYMSFETVNTEYNLSVKIGDNFFGGRIDAIVKDNGKYYVLDYKTGSAPKEAKYDFQTMIYLLSARAFFKTNNISFIYLDLKNKSEVKIDLTKDLASEYINKLKEVSKNLSKSDFKPSQKGCKDCEYKVICYDKKLSD